MTKRILVRCPITAKLSATGRLVEDELWADSKFAPYKATCPYCAQKHIWLKDDVLLAR